MKLKGKRILVSGGSGFLGRNLVNKLRGIGARVITIDKADGRDMRDWSAIKDVADSLDVIYHLAALNYVPFSFENARETYETNILGTINMLELGQKLDVEKFIFTSSYVYGNPQYLPIDENHYLNPTNPYARSKVIGEELCKGYHLDSGLKCIILRPFNVYGEGQNESFLVPHIIKQLKTGKIQLKDPNPRRDFLYVEDMTNAYIKAGEYNTSDFEVFNIGYGKSYSVEELVAKIIRIYGSSVKVNYVGDSRKNEVGDTIANINKAKNILGWFPEVDVDEGLKRMLDAER